MSQTHRVKAFASALDDPAVLDQHATWYSNGARGYLHGSRRCQNLNDITTAVQHHLSINEAALRKCCDSCFTAGLEQVFPNHFELQRVVSRREQIERIAHGATRPKNASETFQQLTQLQNATRASQQRDASENGFTRADEEMRSRSREIERVLLARLQDQKHELVLMVAADLLAPESSFECSPQIASEAENRLLGGTQRFSSRGALAVYNVWLSNIAAGKPADEVSAKVLTTVSELALHSINQLEGIATDGPTPDLAQTAQLQWMAERDRTGRELLARWNERLYRMTSSTDEVLIGLNMRRIAAHDTLGIAVACHSVASNDANGTVIVRVPAPVATWLLRVGSHRGNGSNTSVVELDATGTDDTVLDTAVKLWDPGSGTYADPRVCITAALALHR